MDLRAGDLIDQLRRGDARWQPERCTNLRGVPLSGSGPTFSQKGAKLVVLSPISSESLYWVDGNG